MAYRGEGQAFVHSKEARGLDATKHLDEAAENACGAPARKAASDALSGPHAARPSDHGGADGIAKPRPKGSAQVEL